MSEIKQPSFYQKALEYVRNEISPIANVEYLGDYEGYEIYEVFSDEEMNEALVRDFVMANESEVHTAYYHEAVALARKFNS